MPRADKFVSCWQRARNSSGSWIKTVRCFFPTVCLVLDLNVRANRLSVTIAAVTIAALKRQLVDASQLQSRGVTPVFGSVSPAGLSTRQPQITVFPTAVHILFCVFVLLSNSVLTLCLSRASRVHPFMPRPPVRQQPQPQRPHPRQ